ncbi:hypothetical protein [Clostridium sp.]|uniref:hypothetical protein n=1 Tax=Clostridium sp. TaxID=1506 RepID=UPI002613B639|nr:hypothetical protein [Clostridium sp.]
MYDKCFASTDDKILVYEEDDNDVGLGSYGEAASINVVDESKSELIFNGIVQNVKTSNENGIYYLEIEAFSSSIELVVEEKSRVDHFRMQI